MNGISLDKGMVKIEDFRECHNRFRESEGIRQMGKGVSVLGLRRRNHWPSCFQR